MAKTPSIEDAIAEAGKAMNDLHNMVSHINDLRILAIVVTCTAYMAAIGFMIYKFCLAPKHHYLKNKLPDRDEDLEEMEELRKKKKYVDEFRRDSMEKETNA